MTTYGLEYDRFVCCWHHQGWHYLSLGVRVWLAGPSVELHLPGGYLQVGVPQRWRKYHWPANSSPLDSDRTVNPLAPVQRYIYGWFIFVRHVYKARSKKRGAGAQTWQHALRGAACDRWICDGQMRGSKPPAWMKR